MYIGLASSSRSIYATTPIHVTKVGDRFAALEPISQGVREQFGSVEADAGRGLSLRMDHGSQYRSDDFRAQLKSWGITPSYAFVAEPQTNGVAERFNRTMKEQAIHGRLFNNVEKFVLPPSRSRTDTITNGVLKNWASRHPLEAGQAQLLPLAA
ncbi:MAG: hypothetical protein VB135_03965 [Burkholderia sp.]